MPDYSVDGLHYMSVLHTPIETDGKARTVIDFQPRKNAKDSMEQGKLTMEDKFEHFSKTFVCEKELVKKYVQHLQILDINKRKRADVRKIQKQQRENKQFADYNWIRLFEARTLKNLKVKELDKYLNHYNLHQSLKLKKSEKVTLISTHLALLTLQAPSELDDFAQDQDEDKLSESESEDSDNDTVLDTTAAPVRFQILRK